MGIQGEGGVRSKFKERLRNIRLSRIKKKRFHDENQEFIQEKVKEIRDVIQKEPNRVRTIRVGSSKDNKKDTVNKVYCQIL